MNKTMDYIMTNKRKDENDELDSLIYLALAITISCLIIVAIIAFIIQSTVYSRESTMVTTLLNFFYWSISSTPT